MNWSRGKKRHTKLVCHATLKLSSTKSENGKKRKSFLALTHSEWQKNVTQLEVMACKRKKPKSFYIKHFSFFFLRQFSL